MFSFSCPCYKFIVYFVAIFFNTERNGCHLIRLVERFFTIKIVIFFPWIILSSSTPIYGWEERDIEMLHALKKAVFRPKAKKSKGILCKCQCGVPYLIYRILKKLSDAMISTKFWEL